MKRVTRIPARPDRPLDAHKGAFGTLTLLAGSDGMLGASILAARGALRGGVGLCRACLPRGLMAPFTVAVPSATTLARTPALRGFFASTDAIVVGPGLGTGQEARKQVRQVIRGSTVGIVLDADGLNLCAPLRRPMTAAAPVVLTPHPGEAARLLNTDSASVQKDREAAVSDLVGRSGQTVVLKGARTLVADGIHIYENQTGNPGMSTGGSGDVLAGLMGALLAQGMDPFDAAVLAVHLHGKAGDLVADRLSQSGLIAEDLPLAIAEVMK